MTEPVAYIYNYANGDYALWHKTEQHIEKAIPLYTKEQLQPHVKMTQAEFDEFKDLYDHGNAINIYDFIIYVLNRICLYPKITNKLMDGLGAVKAKKQAEIANLIVNYNPEHPEETIEIITEKKWFVRSKKPDSDGDWQFLNGIDEPNDWGYSHNEEDTNNPRNIAYPFDTKERAEEWKNPITEVVLLPIGDE